MSKCQASFGAQFGVYVLIKLFLSKIHRVITVWIYFLEKSALTSLIAGLKAPYTENPTETTQPLTILLLCGILAPFKIGKTIRS